MKFPDPGREIFFFCKVYKKKQSKEYASDFFSSQENLFLEMLKGGIPIWNFLATLDISPGHHFDLIECIHQGGGDIMIKGKLKRHIKFFPIIKNVMRA